MRAYFETCRIPNSSSSDREAIAALASQCVQLASQGLDTSLQEAAINQRVARLYGIHEEV